MIDSSVYFLFLLIMNVVDCFKTLLFAIKIII